MSNQTNEATLRSEERSEPSPSWFHIFDGTYGVWFADDRTWGPYRDAAEFETYAEAYEVAAEELKGKGCEDDSVICVLADLGSVHA